MSINTRIKSALETTKSLSFIADDNVDWSGPEVNTLAILLKTHIESFTSPGTNVGIHFRNSAVQAVAILAALISERVPVIFNYSDVQTDLKTWLARSQVSMMIMTSDMNDQLDILDDMQLPYMTLSTSGEITGFSRANKMAASLPNFNIKSPDGTALIIFTSGSTGQPKGILVPSEGLCKTADFLIPYFQLSPTTVAPTILPICHSLTLNTHFIPTVLAGGRSFILDSQLDLNKIYRIILKNKATFISLIGGVLGACWDEVTRRSLPKAEHVAHIQLAGGTITANHLFLARELFPNATIHKGYGLTEAIRVSMINSQSPDFASASVGTPLPFVSIEIRNEGGQPIYCEEVGEIYVKGPNTALGTTNTTTQLVDADGFLATGDLGHWNQSKQLFVTGRKDSVFKINGKRISGFEIETTALKLSNIIRNAQCILIENERLAHAKIILLLEVQYDLQQDLSEEFLQELHHKMWKKFEAMNYFPREVFLMNHFPRTSNGKIALKKMKELYLESERKSIVANNQTALQFFKLNERMM